MYRFSEEGMLGIASLSDRERMSVTIGIGYEDFVPSCCVWWQSKGGHNLAIIAGMTPPP